LCGESNRYRLRGRDLPLPLWLCTCVALTKGLVLFGCGCGALPRHVLNDWPLLWLCSLLICLVTVQPRPPSFLWRPGGVCKHPLFRSPTPRPRVEHHSRGDVTQPMSLWRLRQPRNTAKLHCQRDFGVRSNKILPSPSPCPHVCLSLALRCDLSFKTATPSRAAKPRGL
jgi:hypothetical protein